MAHAFFEYICFMDFSERIAAVMRHYNLQAKDLADLCGVQRTAITHILNGRNRPSVSFLGQLSEAYPEINTRWLLHGRGNMFTNVTNVASVEELPPYPSKIFNTKAEKCSESLDQQSAAPPEGTLSHVTNVTGDLFDNQAGKGLREQLPLHQGHKAVREIVIFYEDGTFRSYRPDAS